MIQNLYVVARRLHSGHLARGSVQRIIAESESQALELGKIKRKPGKPGSVFCRLIRASVNIKRLDP